MKKLLISIVTAFAAISIFAAGSLFAAGPQMKFTEATELTMVGKVFPDTPNPYERMDFTKYGGWTEKDINLLEMSSGIIISFKTNSPVISVKPEFKSICTTNASGFASRGFDLYIKKDGVWKWAGVTSFGMDMSKENGKERVLATDMDSSVKECIMYLPTYSKETSVKIGVTEDSFIEKGAVPFKHRICIHGSSFMHGASTGRAGQTVPGFLTRMTGFQFCSLGVSGDCRMQPQFANALKDAEVDAYVIDAFSNGSAQTVQENLFNFIETLQSTKPDVPIIFISTIWRERRNFNMAEDKREQEKIDMANKLMKEALKKYKNVYYITVGDAADKTGDTSLDGVHPSDWGYHLWAESIVKPLTKILAKYGIRSASCK